MFYIFYLLTELIYYSFFTLFIKHFNHVSMLNSVWFLLIFSILLNIPILFLIYFLKDRKKFFIFSSIYILFVSSIFYVCGSYILNLLHVKVGLINFTMYLYKILFMFSPFLSIYFLGIHKLIYKHKKKQLYLIIALRRIVELLIILIFISFSNFSTILYLLSFAEICLYFLPIFLCKNNINN